MLKIQIGVGMDKSSYMYRFKLLALGVWAIASFMVLSTGCLPRGTDFSKLYREPMPAMIAVNYTALRASILTPQCISCHADFGTEEGLLNYVVPGDSTSSALYRSVANGSMPPKGPPLTGTALGMFKTYIDGLKVSEGGNPTPTPVITPSPVPGNPPVSDASYATIRARLLVPRCLRCHADFGTEAGLANYITSGDPESSALVQSIVNGSMPPSGAAIGPEDLTLLKTYVSELKQ